jgi:hypothetical protein
VICHHLSRLREDITAQIVSDTIIILISFRSYRTSIINMPKPGIKSITVSENEYKKFFEVYEKNRKGLELKGIMSFSGYLTNRMEEMMIKDEVFAKHSPFIEKIAVDQNRVILKDNKKIELQRC